jgi:hypothetical protein
VRLEGTSSLDIRDSAGVLITRAVDRAKFRERLSRHSCDARKDTFSAHSAQVARPSRAAALWPFQVLAERRLLTLQRVSARCHLLLPRIGVENCQTRSESGRQYSASKTELGARHTTEFVRWKVSRWSQAAAARVTQALARCLMQVVA